MYVNIIIITTTINCWCYYTNIILLTFYNYLSLDAAAIAKIN